MRLGDLAQPKQVTTPTARSGQTLRTKQQGQSNREPHRRAADRTRVALRTWPRNIDETSHRQAAMSPPSIPSPPSRQSPRNHCRQAWCSGPTASRMLSEPGPLRSLLVSAEN